MGSAPHCEDFDGITYITPILTVQCGSGAILNPVSVQCHLAYNGGTVTNGVDYLLVSIPHMRDELLFLEFMTAGYSERN